MAQQVALPRSEVHRLTREPADGVLGDGHESLPEVSHLIALRAVKVSLRSRRQPARGPVGSAANFSLNSSSRVRACTIAMPSLARSLGVSPNELIHL